MGQSAHVGSDEAPPPADQVAFYSRVEQLYLLYEDWTGETEEGETLTEEARRQCRQSDGSACIESHIALTTILTFVVRLADDLGVEQDDFQKVVAEIFAGIDEEDEDDGDEGAEGDSEPS